ncbi:MFS transporter [Bacillus sp. PS06]|uniref:MFS transporter n=1 Tax=Bacillus sp. PS06 TaxID=2764176 RepID=UPI00178289D8|nr:MFS transporter [Bacillus sp. PS06]MBD8067674.1 MFS transporter [Bacillus sp. PS06]
MVKPKLWTKDFILVSTSNLFIFLTFYALLVTLPIYALQEMKAKASEAGLLVTIFLVAAIIIRPFAGQAMKRFGKRIIFFISLVIFLGSSVLYFLPDTILTLLILRFFHGIGFGMATTVCGTIVADLIPDSRRGEGMGYYIMSSNLAMVLGPFLGLTIMNQWGEGPMFTFSALFALCALAFSLFIKLPKEQVAQETKARSKESFNIKDFFELSAVRISIVAALFAIVYSSILSFVSVYAKDLGLLSVANFFFVVYAFVLLLSRPFTGKWYDRFGANVIIYPCIVCFAIGMFLLSQTTTASLFLISAALIGLGWGTLFPSFQTIAIEKAAPERRGLATATFLSIFDLGIGLGSFIIGLAAANVEFNSLYFYCSLFVLVGIAIYYLLHGKGHTVTYKKSEATY